MPFEFVEGTTQKDKDEHNSHNNIKCIISRMAFSGSFAYTALPKELLDILFKKYIIITHTFNMYYNHLLQ